MTTARSENAAYVAGRIELSRRRDSLSWSHHYQVAKFQPIEQDACLNKAESEGWTSKELREAIRLASERSVEFDSPAAIRQARDTLWHWWERYADRVSKPERARLLAEIVLDLGEVLYVGKGGDHTSNRC